MIEWAAACLEFKGKPIWLVVDGGYAKREVIRRSCRKGITLIGRLPRDAALRSLPGPQPASSRALPKYGKEVITCPSVPAIDKVGKPQRWSSYGKKVTKTYKTFLAT